MTEKEEKERIELFRQAFREIAEKYRISIGGCGCCGSPFLYDLDTNKLIEEKVDLDPHLPTVG